MAVYASTRIAVGDEEYRAMAYYRLSKSHGEDHESNSISNQRKLIHAFLENNESIRLVDEAYDDGYTGTNYDRPGFLAVMDAVREGRVNCIIVKDLSRLGREYVETGRYLEMIFPSLGVRFIAINDDVDSRRQSSADEIIIPMKNIMNESYCRELSRKLRKQFRIQRSSGEFLGAFAAYGYLKSPEDKHRLVVDEYAAEVVRGIFDLKLKGHSQKAIAEWLNSMGVLSPAEYKKSIGLNYSTGFKTSGSSKWSPVAVKRILENPIYVGRLVQGVYGTPNYKVKKLRKRSQEEWVVVNDNHEAIVDPLQFAAVQRMLRRDTRTPPNGGTLLPLAGVLFCPDCGRQMCRRTVSRGKRSFHYYVCSTHKSGKGCSSHSISQRDLEQAVLRAIGRQIDVVVEMEKLIRQVDESDIAGAQTKRLDMMIAKAEEDLEAQEGFRAKLYEALCDSLIDRDEYQKLRSRYTDRIRSANAAIERLRSQRQELAASRRDHGWAEEFTRFSGEGKLTHEMVASLIDRVFVYEDKRIRIEFAYGDQLDRCLQALEQMKGEVL